MQLTEGMLIVDGKCYLENDATNVSDAIEFGDGVWTGSNLDVFVMPGASLEVTRGILQYNNV